MSGVMRVRRKPDEDRLRRSSSAVCWHLSCVRVNVKLAEEEVLLQGEKVDSGHATAFKMRDQWFGSNFNLIGQFIRSSRLHKSNANTHIGYARDIPN
jgi:hypothetical protein